MASSQHTSLAEDFKQLYEQQGWVPQSQKTLMDLGVRGFYSIPDEDFFIYRAVTFDFEDGSTAYYVKEEHEVICA
jgi:hypothetical protein